MVNKDSVAGISFVMEVRQAPLLNFTEPQHHTNIRKWLYKIESFHRELTELEQWARMLLLMNPRTRFRDQWFPRLVTFLGRPPFLSKTISYSRNIPRDFDSCSWLPTTFIWSGNVHTGLIFPSKVCCMVNWAEHPLWVEPVAEPKQHSCWQEFRPPILKWIFQCWELCAKYC